jgi:hypothetical protein
MAKTNKDELIVYWSPYYSVKPDERYDWNMIYSDPEPVVSSLRKNKVPSADRNKSILYCPAFKQLFKNTYAFSNLIDSTFEFNKQTGQFQGMQENQIHGTKTMMTFLEDRRVLWLPLGWLFFSEESIQMEITPPYIHDTVHGKYAAIVPGAYDISQWFRPIHLELQLWEKQDRFHLPEEPVMYARFNTNRKVVLKRFELTADIFKIAESVADTKSMLGRFKSMEHRYATFKRSRTNDILLRKIKEAVLD